ncbi:hypothetical protein Tco_0510484 [Tanacetum coccineum]
MDTTLSRQNNAFKNELMNDIKNMMSIFFQMNTASSSGSGLLPSNTIANPRGDLKAITTQSGISYDGPPISTLHSLPSPRWWKGTECMRTRSSLEYIIPRRRNRRRSRQQQEAIPIVDKYPIQMADERPMAEQLQAPIGGFESAIVVPHINAQNFEH